MIPRPYLPPPQTSPLCVALLSGPPLLIFSFSMFFVCPSPFLFFFSCPAIASLTASVHTSSGPVPTQTEFPWQQIHSELQVTNRLSALRAYSFPQVRDWALDSSELKEPKGSEMCSTLNPILLPPFC